MCTQSFLTLRCEHVAAALDICPQVPGSGPTQCKRYKLEKLRHPFPSGVQVPECPQSPGCPYELRGGNWNCCWCGKIWITTGRCGCRMISNNQEYFCEHICCNSCGKGSHIL